MISVSEAHETINRFIPEPEIESVELKEATNRILAKEIRANFPQPRFDNSAMDGFAVRWEDTSEASPDNPIALQLKGILSAGTSTDIPLTVGECYQIMTGAPIPPGADAVVMVENTSGFHENGEVSIFRPAIKDQHIRFEGEEIKEGELLLEPGTRISAAESGVIATFGYAKVDVYKRPWVTLFVTGDELREPGEVLEPGQIYNSNLYLLSDLTKRVGAQIVIKEVLEDRRESLSQFLTQALGDSEIIVTSGGVSMGRYDYVRDVFFELGVKEHFRKVAQKPGKPLFFGTSEGTLIFGLPGNPVSSFICFMEYVWPTCERWMGLEPKRKVEMTLATPFPRELEKHRYLFGDVWLEDGRLVGAPSTKLGSHMLTSTVGANCILETAPGEGLLSAGETITANLLPWGSLGKLKL